MAGGKNKVYEVVLTKYGQVQVVYKDQSGRHRDSHGRYIKFDPEEFYRQAKETYINELAELGYDAIEDAYGKGHSDAPKEYDSKGKRIPDGKWRHKTGNLHDSFGSAVFEGGRLVPSSIRVLGPEISKHPDEHTEKSGRDTLIDFFYRARYGEKKNEIVLVCIAAMYYTKYLEDGTHYGKYEIMVVSAAADYIKTYWRHYVSEKSRHIVLKGLKAPSFLEE